MPQAIVINRKVLSESQCKKLISDFKKNLPTAEKYGGDDGRVSSLVDLLEKDHPVIFKKVYTSNCKANNSFQFKLNRYPKTIGVIEYLEGGFCGWHFDGFFAGDEYGYYPNRKMSCVIMLSKPGIDFQGGQLEFDEKLPGHDKDLILNQGDIVYFPSFLFHRVNTVTKGFRYTGVMFCEGKPFS